MGAARMGSRIENTKRWLSDRWGWVVVAGASVIYFLVFGFMLVFSIVFVALQEEFKSSVTQTAWMGSLPIGICCACSPLISLLIERFGPRAIVVTGLAISSVGIIVTSFLHSLPPMYFSFSLAFGFGSGMVFFGCLSLTLTYFPLKNSTRSTAIPMASSNLGAFTLGPLTYLLQTRYGWRNMLRIMGSLIGVICIPLSFLVLKPPSKPRIEHKTICASGRTKYSKIASQEDENSDARNEGIKSLNNSSRHETSAEMDKTIDECDLCDNTERMAEGRKMVIKGRAYQENETQRSPICRILRTLLYPDVLLLSFSVFGYGLVDSVVLIQLVNFVISIGHTAEQGTQAVMVMSISITIGKILLVLFADMAPFPKLGFFLIASCIGSGILLSFLWVHEHIAVLLLTGTLGVTVIGTCDSLPYSVSNNTFGVSIGTQALPIIAFFHGAGFMFASFLGESVDRTGSYEMTLYVCIGVYAVCALFCVLVPVLQRCFAKDRFVMDVYFECKHEESTKDGIHTSKIEKALCVDEEENVTYIVTDKVSSV
ncbi:monocarboxylate transporter 12-like [Lytechinus variegatus]|uniref:monocarboxylate transporter 12-like n=1 Tax=Lytechinus variegatus TaxID=7654 RepID=UPI001BB2B618|nr:monocarboxylate transporter 12-like [Lytechinus variegatus]